MLPSYIFGLFHWSLKPLSPSPFHLFSPLCYFTSERALWFFCSPVLRSVSIIPHFLGEQKAVSNTLSVSKKKVMDRPIFPSPHLPLIRPSLSPISPAQAVVFLLIPPLSDDETSYETF